MGEDWEFHPVASDIGHLTWAVVSDAFDVQPLPEKVCSANSCFLFVT